MTQVFRTIAGWLIAVMVTVTAISAQAQLASFDKSELAIHAGSKRHSFQIELAITGEQMAQGLMFRRQMAADAGMLFLHPSERELSMWMKNTYLPLDMLFIAADGRITRIAARTVPHSLATISSEGPALAVLELNAGTAERLGIKPGDRVEHAAFKR
jgi:uncharacterized membrane protein (UPF0127 family)